MAVMLYEPLPNKGCTRLIKLHPGSGADQLTFNFVIVDLAENHIPYTAVSYVWGDTSVQRYAWSAAEFAPITVNLESILLKVRSPVQDTLLWVDALCIDQSQALGALQERASQVSMMGDIFSSAHDVLVDLGDQPAGYSELVGLEARLSRFSEAEWQGLTVQSQRMIGLFPDMNHVYHLAWHALSALLARPYFRRIWVVQEIVLASSVSMMIGHDKWPLDRIDRLCTRAVHLYRRISRAHEIATAADFLPAISVSAIMDGLGSLHFMRSMRGSHQSNGPTADFVGLVNLLREHKATDLRDHIYALLGMVSDSAREGLLVDYTQTLQTISLNTSHHFLKTQPDHKLLNLAAGVDHATDLPSWCLALDEPTQSLRMNVWSLLNSNIIYDLLNACGDTSLRFFATADPLIASIQGCVIDRVQDIGVPISHTAETGIIRISKQWYLKAKALVWRGLNHLPENAIKDTFWRTLVCDCAGRMRVPTSFEQCFDAWILTHGLQDVGEQNFWTSNTGPHTFDIQSEARLYAGALYHLKGRALGITANGMLTLLPTSAVIGDHICIFGGIRVPFVVRSSGPHYRLVGPCYVHSIMDGEAARSTLFQLEHMLLK